MVVISLDLTAKVYPIIYSLDKLPYDCLKLVAMPKPVTGVLVIAANSLLHVSQGSPGVGVAVNGYVKKTTEFPGMLYEPDAINLGLSLDGAKALAFGGDRCLIFMQNGNWAVVQMKMDGSKIVGMNITEIDNNKKGASSPMAVVPSCVTNVKQGEYFFLGSRVGDSLLIKWKESNGKSQLNEFRVCDTLLNTGPIVDMTIGDVESNQKTEDEEDKEDTVAGTPDLELVSCSGHGKNGALCVFQRHIHPQTSFSFNQLDSQAIWSIKCRKEILYSEATSAAGEQHENARWESVENDSSFDEAFDKLLFISKSKSTMVLSAGDELQELVKTGFYTRGPTITVNTLFDATRIVQVYATGVMILTPEGKRIHTIPIRGSKIVDASIRDPYILLTLENNKVLALQGDAVTKNITPIQLPSYIKESSVSMASIFADTSGLFSSVSEKKTQIAAKKAAKAAAAAAQSKNTKKRKAGDDVQNNGASKKSNASKSISTDDFDEVDMDLYGDQLDDDIKHEPVVVENTPAVGAAIDGDEDDEMLYGVGTTQNDVKEEKEDVVPMETDTILLGKEEIDEANVSLLGGGLNEITRVSFWAIIYTTDGTLQIYSLPDFKEYFVCPQFANAPSLITDFGPGHKKSKEVNTIIREILVTNIGKERKDPHLVARTETNDIIIYKAFSFVPTAEEETKNSSDRLALRFSRVNHEYISRTSAASNDPRKQSKKKEIIDEFEIPDIDDVEEEPVKKSSSSKTSKQREKLLIAFNDVAGFAGVFVAGPQPAWLLCSCKSFVRVHPMKTSDPVIGFTQFHNVNCKHGFITVDAKTTIRLSGLRTNGVIYDLDWVMQKIPLHQSVHKIQYHPIMKVYAVLVSTPGPVRLQNDEEVPEGEAPPKTEEREPGEFLPEVDKFSMIMVSPVTWETVDEVEFEEFEQCFSLQCAALESKQTSTGRKYFMVVGTGGLRGEDTTMRGSVSFLYV